MTTMSNIRSRVLVVELREAYVDLTLLIVWNVLSWELAARNLPILGPD